MPVKIKLGDLVMFRTGVESWSMDYLDRTPGIVRWVRYNEKTERGSAGVYWKNGETTTEHLSFLEPFGQDFIL